MKLEFGAGEDRTLDFNLGKVIRQIIIKQFLENYLKNMYICGTWTDIGQIHIQNFFNYKKIININTLML